MNSQNRKPLKVVTGTHFNTTSHNQQRQLGAKNKRFSPDNDDVFKDSRPELCRRKKKQKIRTVPSINDVLQGHIQHSTSKECLAFIRESWSLVDVNTLSSRICTNLLFFAAEHDLATVCIDLITSSKTQTAVDRYNGETTPGSKFTPIYTAYKNDSWEVLQILREHTGVEVDTIEELCEKFEDECTTTSDY